MRKQVYLFELDSVRNSKAEIERAQKALFEEIILNGNSSYVSSSNVGKTTSGIPYASVTFLTVFLSGARKQLPKNFTVYNHHYMHRLIPRHISQPV